MEVGPYVDGIRSQLEVAADAGGEEARGIADRLIAPLESAIRLALQDVLSAAAEEITCELAPGSVELRLRGRDVELVVTPPPAERPVDESTDADATSVRGWGSASGGLPGLNLSAGPVLTGEGDGEEDAIARINVRMPEQLKARVERAAAGEGLSVNAWLVRAAALAVERRDPGIRPARRAPQGAQRFTGWVR
jgi:hypothetical protein